MWKKIGEKAKFYCSVRVSHETVVLLTSKMEPMREQIDQNTSRIHSLEESVRVESER